MSPVPLADTPQLRLSLFINMLRYTPVVLRCVSKPLVRCAPRASSIMFARFQSTRIPVTHATEPQELDILAQQRKNRPLSPDLAIYRPQLTWIMSGAHRLTGIALTGSFYIALWAYAGLPLVGYEFSVADVAAALGEVPAAIKVPVKFLLTIPLTFHSWNGIRHLIWDDAKELTLKGVYRTGYATQILSVITSLWLALL